MNKGFADPRVRPLRHVASSAGTDRRRCSVGCPSRIRTSVHGSKVRCPTTRRRGSGGLPGLRRAKKWSGRRDSNPRPSPWQGDALPTEPLPLDIATTDEGGAESQNRTGDTAIFSRVLYQLSYLGPMANQAFGRPSAIRRIARCSRSAQRDDADHAGRMSVVGPPGVGGIDGPWMVPVRAKPRRARHEHPDRR